MILLKIVFQNAVYCGNTTSLSVNNKKKRKMNESLNVDLISLNGNGNLTFVSISDIYCRVAKEKAK